MTLRTVIVGLSWIAADPAAPALEGRRTVEPAFGAAATWINPALRDTVLSRGYAVIDQASVLATHLSEIVRRHSQDLLTRQETKRLLDALVDVPFALPTAVAGLALTALFSQNGWFGPPLAALGVTVTAMFGPTIEQETHPIGPGRHTILTHQVWCRPCMLRECPLDHRCMSEVTPEIKAKMFEAGPEDSIHTKTVTGKPCRTLRNRFSDAWDTSDTAPPTLPAPLQAYLWWSEGRTRVERVRAKEFLTYPVGQLVADMRAETSVREVVRDMLEELLTAKERMDHLIG